MHTVITQSSDRLRKPVDETFATPAGTTPDEWRGPHCVDCGVSATSHIAHGTHFGARCRSSQHERAARSSSRPYQHRQLAAKRPLLHSNCLTSTFLLLHRLPVTELCQSLYMAEKNSSRAFKLFFTDLKTPKDGRENQVRRFARNGSSAMRIARVLGLTQPHTPRLHRTH